MIRHISNRIKNKFILISYNKVSFSLLEMICVLIILSIVTAITIVRINEKFSYELKTETDKLRERLRFAHILAMNADAAWGLQLHSNYYELFCNANSTNIVSFPGETTTSVNLPNGISLSPSMIISFNMMGQPCSDVQAINLFNNDINIVLSKGSSSETITITKNTGYIP